MDVSAHSRHALYFASYADTSNTLGQHLDECRPAGFDDQL
jgi:hypothetical protein